MRDEKMIEMFDSIPKFETYSKCSQSLARMFKHNSLKNLIHELKYPKRFHNREFLDEFSEKSPIHEKNFNDKIDLDNLSPSKKNQNEFETSSSLFNTERNDPNVKTETDHIQKPLRYNIKKKLSNLSEVPDPCHYNPNYNSIYKKIPSVKMVKPSFSPKKVAITSPNIGKRKKILEQKQTQLTEESKNMNEKKKVSLLPPIDYFGKNHALRFSQYPDRKSMIQPSCCGDKLSYLEPFDYLTNINKAPDFKKMKERKEGDLINASSLATPSIGYYQPKYDLVIKKSPKISFSPRKKVKLSKQFLIKKIWNSYDVPTEYQLVKLDTDVKTGEENKFI